MKWLLFLILLFSLNAQSKVRVPRNLSKTDRVKTLDILGLNSSTKYLSVPYPLGGYDGIEMGLSLYSIPVSDLAALGDKVQSQDSFEFPILSVGKGVYGGFDFFFHFMPFSQDTHISEFGGSIRWTFMEFKFLPLNMALQVHGNSINFNDEISVQSSGSDLTLGLVVKNLSFYFGGGYTQSSGQFEGGATGLTDTGNTEKELATAIHSFVGLTFQVRPFFLAFQVDQYNEPSFGLKFGYRN